MVNIVDEQVERFHALLQARFEHPPFVARHDARDDVERENLLRAFLVAIDAEGDALLVQQLLRRFLASPEFLGRQRVDLLEKGGCKRSRLAALRHQLVIEPVGLIAVKIHHNAPFIEEMRHRKTLFLT